MNYQQDYVAPTLVVDSVVFQMIDDTLSVLLIERGHEPFRGAWALPGGYNPAGKTTREAMRDVLLRKTGIRSTDFTYTEQLFTFDTVARDPRGHAVSVTYMCLGMDITPATSETTQNPRFFAVNQLPQLAYDHEEIIAYAHERLRSKLTYTNAVFALLPPTFTLTQLQNTYEAIFGRTFDKRNFRKKYLSLDLIEETDKMRQTGAHRPARLYRFKQQSLHVLERSFD